MKARVLAVMVCVMAVVNVASADIIRGIDIDFVTIGHAGNPGDTRTEANPYGCGAVGYDYRIGKYEVTNAQWNAFTTAAGAPTGNPYYAYDQSALYTGTQQPANSISWYEAAQFCNYLTSGDKSKGVYQFSGNNTNPESFFGIDRVAAQAAYRIIYFLPTEDEWYKAAYYKSDGSGYSLYDNGLNTIPPADNGWNYFGGSYYTPWDVGIGTQEQNGTFDMMGNIEEWNETLISSYRGIRGGGYHTYFYYDSDLLSSSDRHYGNPYYQGIDSGMGFRVASVPEPATLLLLGLGAVRLRSRQAVMVRKHRQ